MNQSRWKSPVAWGTVLPVITLLGDAYGLWNIIGMPKDDFAKLFTSVIAVLIAFGIFNNPENRDGF